MTPEKHQKTIDENGWIALHAHNDLSNPGFTGEHAILKPAIQSADPPEYVLLLNSDTIVRPNAFAALIEFMDQHPEVGIAGSRLEDPDGTPQASAFRFQSPMSEFDGSLKFGLVTRLLNRWNIAPPIANKPCETDWVAGASMIIRKEVMRDIGFLTVSTTMIDFLLQRPHTGQPGTSRQSGVHRRARDRRRLSGPKRLPPFIRSTSTLFSRTMDFLCGDDRRGDDCRSCLVEIARDPHGKTDSNPPLCWRDTIRHSVFLKVSKSNKFKPCADLKGDFARSHLMPSEAQALVDRRIF